MPVYEFECEECGDRFEELTPSDTRSLACPGLRLGADAAPALAGLAGRAPAAWGRGAESGESQRREREAARGERLAETKRKRAAGEL